jgi:hypothetical protein
MHASLNNNLTLKVRNEINDFVNNVEDKGYTIRRIPSVELIPLDKEYAVRLARKREKAFKKVHD